jgi:glucose-6-phosphate isomerase
MFFTKKISLSEALQYLKENEKTLGELFSFFILETILIGKMLNLNPYDQPGCRTNQK